MNSKRRLDRLEKSVKSEDLSGKQFVGRFYDELTTEERRLWIKYYESLIAPGHEPDIEAYEQVHGYFSEGLHFICEDRPKPPTEAEFRKRVQEVEALMQKAIEEYNAPEVKAKREAEYLELQKVGAQRKAAEE